MQMKLSNPGKIGKGLTAVIIIVLLQYFPYLLTEKEAFEEDPVSVVMPYDIDPTVMEVSCYSQN